MFTLKGLLSTLGTALICTVLVSFLIGIFNIQNEWLGVSMLFVISYVVIGITAPVWNPKTPYFSSYLASLLLTIINFFVALYVLDINVLYNPEGVNHSLILSSMTSLMTTFVVLQIIKRKQVKKYD